jgi:hypothetical protein
VISLNYNPYNSCNHFQSHGSAGFYVCTRSPWLFLLWMHPKVLYNNYQVILVLIENGSFSEDVL